MGVIKGDKCYSSLPDPIIRDVYSSTLYVQRPEHVDTRRPGRLAFVTQLMLR